MKTLSPLQEVQDRMCVAFAVMMLALLAVITCAGCGCHAWYAGRWWDVGLCAVIVAAAAAVVWRAFVRHQRLGVEALRLMMQRED